MSDVAKAYLKQIKADFEKAKALGEGAIKQLDEAGLNFQPSPESNSVAMIVRHMVGNMRSRFTDFLTTDGEKTFRNRDLEFADGTYAAESIKFAWEDGWQIVFNALKDLKPEDVLLTVKIRKEDHTVMQALQRQLGHYSYHIGQMVMLAKIYQGDDWQTLSIAKGKSKEFNAEMGLDEA